jgi:CRISPR-associated protein Cas5t
MLRLELEAPFAVCRTFTAGWYRPTATFLTPTSVYGLLLNVAGIDSRLREEDARHDGKVPASLTIQGLPAVRLALGIRADKEATGEACPQVQTIYQQLHNYPVGKDAGIDPALARGSKNNISPVRREFLSDVRALVYLDGNPELENRVRQGLAGTLPGHRYGLPFLGDNQFMLDHLHEIGNSPEEQLEAFWYERIDETAQEPRERTTRMTIWIDRADLSQTISALFAPSLKATTDPPPSAWTTIDPPVPPPPPPKPRRTRSQ